MYDTSKYEHFKFVCFAGRGPFRVTLTKKVSVFGDPDFYRLRTAKVAMNLLRLALLKQGWASCCFFDIFTGHLPAESSRVSDWVRRKKSDHAPASRWCCCTESHPTWLGRKLSASAGGTWDCTYRWRGNSLSTRTLPQRVRLWGYVPCQRCTANGEQAAGWTGAWIDRSLYVVWFAHWVLRQNL